MNKCSEFHTDQTGNYNTPPHSPHSTSTDQDHVKPLAGGTLRDMHFDIIRPFPSSPTACCRVSPACEIADIDRNLLKDRPPTRRLIFMMRSNQALRWRPRYVTLLLRERRHRTLPLSFHLCDGWSNGTLISAPFKHIQDCRWPDGAEVCSETLPSGCT